MLLKARDMVRATEHLRSGVHTLLWLTDDAVDRISSANKHGVVEHTTMNPLARGMAVGLASPIRTEIGDVNMLTLVSDEELARGAAAFVMARGSYTNYRSALNAARERSRSTRSRIIALCRENSSNIVGRVHFDSVDWRRITEHEHMSESADSPLNESMITSFKSDVKHVFGTSFDDWVETNTDTGHSVLDLFRTAWTLYNSPMEMEVTATTHTVVPGVQPRPHGKGKKKSLVEVDVIDVRRSAPHDHGRGGASPQEHDHRWTVRGHWRNQTCGPGGQLRRQVWIDEHVRGPEDAPLVVRPKVWRI